MQSTLDDCIKKLKNMDCSEKLSKINFSEDWNEKQAKRMFIDFSHITNQLKQIDYQNSKNYISFSIPSEGLLEFLKRKVTKFDANLRNSEWFTQFHYGCLLFSLMNGKFLPQPCNKFFVPNMDFSHEPAKLLTDKQIIKGVLHEYKAILLWKFLSGNDVIHYQEQILSQKIRKILNARSMKQLYNIAYEIQSIYMTQEQRFGIKISGGNERDFAFAEWNFSNYTAKILEDTKNPKFLALKIEFLERCPRYTLFCDNRNHWLTFLGCESDYMYFYDSNLHDNLRKIKKDDVARRMISVLIK